MTPQQNTDHVQTTHTGSLPRPHRLLDLLKAKFSGKPFDPSEWDAALAQEGTDCVRKQVECGIDTVTDGEFSKLGFFTYIRERLEGFESRPGQKRVGLKNTSKVGLVRGPTQPLYRRLLVAESFEEGIRKVLPVTRLIRQLRDRFLYFDGVQLFPPAALPNKSCAIILRPGDLDLTL
jgi:methionine synthase II (cobalamin-independent)